MTAGRAGTTTTARHADLRPFPSFAESARALDTKQVGKERLEGLQILRPDDLEYVWPVRKGA